MSIFDNDPIEMQGEIEIPSDFLEQLKKEMCLSDDIKSKFIDICKYMFTHRISAIESRHENGVIFKISMELPKEWSESKDAAKIGEAIIAGFAEGLKEATDGNNRA